MLLFAYRAATFAAGLAWLFWDSGSMPDWDLPISALMATASALVMRDFDKALWADRNYLLAFVIGCFPVSSVYSLYWTNIQESPGVLVPENFGASWGLFLGCWLVWCFIPRLAKSISNPGKSLQHLLK